VAVAGGNQDEPGVKLYIWLMAVGGLKFLSGIPGVLAARKVWDPDKVGAAQSWYKKFTVGLVLCGLVNGGIFLAAGLYVNKIDENIDADWAVRLRETAARCSSGGHAPIAVALGACCSRAQRGAVQRGG
jgi:hypothetical protein